MRQMISSGSVRAICLDRESILKKLKEASDKALKVFPEIKEVRLFGSLAKGEETGLSDVDLFILVESEQKNPLERMRPYFAFFSDMINIAIDMIVATSNEIEKYSEILKRSIPLSKRAPLDKANGSLL